MLARRFGPMRLLLALVALLSGVALLAEIIFRIDLRLGLAASFVAGSVVVATAVARATPKQRRWIGRTVAVGATSGLIATLSYDVSRTFLSVLDPSPFNPFEAIRHFGQLLVGGELGSGPGVVAGMLYHLLNGTSFGIAYTFLFARDGDTTPRRALVTGIGWGLFLELFQLTLYPGWLDIRTYKEFVTISALGHFVYGATLAGVSRTLLRTRNDKKPREERTHD